MKGIYLTEEGKREIEAKISELQSELSNDSNPFTSTDTNSRLSLYKEILSESIVLPVEESWDMAVDRETILNISYPNGVIIRK